jgi:hypothetical protein
MALTQASEEGLKISNAGTNGQYLQKQSGNTGGLTWADVPAGVGGATGVDFNDNVKARFGTGNDLELRHNGTNSEINHTTSGTLQITGNSLKLMNYDGPEPYVVCTSNGAVELYYDNALKLLTTASGAEVKHTSGEAILKVTSYEGNAANLWLTADDGDDWTDITRLQQGTNGAFSVQNLTASSTWENMIVASPNGGVELYYDNAKQFETVSGGCQFVNDVKFDNNTTGGADAFWDSSDGDFMHYDGAKASWGNDSDLQIYHDGTHNYINSSNGNTFIGVNESQKFQVQHNSEAIINGYADGRVELYYDNSKKFETTASGIEVGGTNYGGGGSSPTVYLSSDSDRALKIHNTTDSTSSLQLTNSGSGEGNDNGFQIALLSSDVAWLCNAENADMRFATNGTEKMRIGGDGLVHIGCDSEPSLGDDGCRFGGGSYHITARDTSASAVFRAFGSGGEFRVIGSGNCQNTNNSYGSISDRVLKENEVDANSQWNDIKALKIKNYNLKSKPGEKHLGVIAQDLEAAGISGLVENNPDELYTANDVLPEGKNIGDVKEKNYKTVKYSILYMKAVKALQEAITKIETLETKVAALEAA